MYNRKRRAFATKQQMGTRGFRHFTYGLAWYLQVGVQSRHVRVELRLGDIFHVVLCEPLTALVERAVSGKP